VVHSLEEKAYVLVVVMHKVAFQKAIFALVAMGDVMEEELHGQKVLMVG
jgi:hypothetical protein